MNSRLIHIRIGNQKVIVELDDTPSARDFAGLLPLTLSLEDYAATEKIAMLPRKLDTTGAPAGVDPEVGDVAYYAPWGNLAIFHKDFGYSEGLVRLGRVKEGIELLARKGTVQAHLEFAN
jgi:hypothetical protein